jgi:hypothetical protein
MALNLSEEELHLLSSVPQMIASAQSVLAGVKDFPNNELI